MLLLEKHWNGLTLLEFLISVVIIAALAIAAVPTYQHYSKKAYYSELIAATSVYQDAVTHCLEKNGFKPNECDGGKAGIPLSTAAKTKLTLGNIDVTNGVIHAIPRESHGVTQSDDYVLTPRKLNGKIEWQASGGACHAGLVPNC
jgi:type IV pilus assembly protein PilA